MPTTNDIQTKSSPASFIPRTSAGYEQQVKMVLENQAVATVYGVKSKCALSDVHDFNITEYLPPDQLFITRDCPRGILKNNNCIYTGYLTLELFKPFHMVNATN